MATTPAATPTPRDARRDDDAASPVYGL